MLLIFIKKHFWDILIFLGVFAVFFLTGISKKSANDSSLIIENTTGGKLEMSEEPLVSSNVSNPPIEPIANTATLPTNLVSPPKVPIDNPVIDNAQATNPYAVLMNRGNQNPNQENPSIQKSLNNLKGEAPSTEALIERNSYFKKLSEQLKDLQGNVNTDEEKPKEPSNSSPDIGDPSNQSDVINDEDDFLVPELDEDLAPSGPQ